MDALRGNRDVRVLPYVGDHFEGVLNANGYRTVDDVVRAFTGYPGLAPDRIREMLGRLCRNPNRYTCQGDVENQYHVSDVNQCLYNSILDLLRQAHARRDDWVALGFTVQPNVPNAMRVPFRSRGTNRMVRTAPATTIVATAGATGADGRRLPRQEGRTACTPIRGEGSTGKRTRRTSTSLGSLSEGKSRKWTGCPHVKRYRILGGMRTLCGGRPTIATTRPSRDRTTACNEALRQAARGEKWSLAREKRDLAKREKALGKKDLPGRRRLNQHIRYYKNRSMWRLDRDVLREVRPGPVSRVAPPVEGLPTARRPPLLNALSNCALAFFSKGNL